MLSTPLVRDLRELLCMCRTLPCMRCASITPTARHSHTAARTPQSDTRTIRDNGSAGRAPRAQLLRSHTLAAAIPCLLIDELHALARRFQRYSIFEIVGSMIWHALKASTNPLHNAPRSLRPPPQILLAFLPLRPSARYARFSLSVPFMKDPANLFSAPWGLTLHSCSRIFPIGDYCKEELIEEAAPPDQRSNAPLARLQRPRSHESAACRARSSGPVRAERQT